MSYSKLPRLELTEQENSEGKNEYIIFRKSKQLNENKKYRNSKTKRMSKTKTKTKRRRKGFFNIF